MLYERTAFITLWFGGHSTAEFTASAAWLGYGCLDKRERQA